MAREAVEGTHLDDPKVREALWKGGAAAVAASTDPMIALARRLDPQARAIRKDFESRVDGALARNGELLFQAAVAVRGTSSYPDATFTLRLSYGTIAGWTESGKQIPRDDPSLGALRPEHGAVSVRGRSHLARRPPEARPGDAVRPRHDQRHHRRQLGVAAHQPERRGGGASSSTGTGARSGGDYGYDAATNRAVALHGQAILEGLEKVYGAGRLVKEIRSHGPD